MDLSKLFFICLPFASQNRAEVWSRVKLVEAQYSTPWVCCAFGNVEIPSANCIFYSRRDDEEVEEGVPATFRAPSWKDSWNPWQAKYREGGLRTFKGQECLKEKKKQKLSFIYREHALSLFDRFSQQLYGETLAKGPIRIICNGM